MNASVLIVGNSDFSTHLREHVRGLSVMTCWQAESAIAASKLLESETPEILLLQASQKDNWEICQAIKQNRHLTWCHCILLDERNCPTVHTTEEVLLRQAGLTTTALETGADAYVWIPKLSDCQNEDTLEHLNRLIQAHFRAALRRIQTYKQLSQRNDLLSSIALVDPLTQLGNRRAFDWAMSQQIQVSRQQAHDMSLLLLDIDFFKRVNDEHGHLVGDEVLRTFAERLRYHMRYHETPFRYGGEEFVVILQNASLPEAHKAAERLRRLIDDAPFVINRHLDLSLTVSAGVASLESGDDDRGEDLIRRADDNLLRAKRGGRNRVITS